MEQKKISVCIATYNMGHLISETIESILNQDYENIEIIVYDDYGTDDTEFQCQGWEGDIKYFKGKENVGVGKAFDKAIKLSTGDYVVLMCADDIIANNMFFIDIATIFEKNYDCAHVSRYYYQFIDGDKERKPVRAWRTRDLLMLASNPSGLAFRKEALFQLECSNKMFIETSSLVADVINHPLGISHCKGIIIGYDAIAVRVHKSTSTTGGYWLKRRVSSPVLDWYNIGCKEILKDYCSLIQIKCNYKMEAVWEEIVNFVKLRPRNLLNVSFYFYSILALLMPRFLLMKLPHLYRKYIGRYITKRINRP